MCREEGSPGRAGWAVGQGNGQGSEPTRWPWLEGGGVFAAQRLSCVVFFWQEKGAVGNCLHGAHAFCLLHSRQKSTDDQEMLFSTL